ncbi:hypothetical protein CK203_085537 [Vitis vinifera]|uniref:Uncharacterized protein n=1 Tax=Vitis vinifera TaxID=29760 RepID=A0A438C2M4_VITVI|nr:hypothetical protein CK203_085537 [Vitis vinifera]
MDHFARENDVCEISQTHKRAAKSLRSKKLFSQGCEVGFHLEVLSFQLAAYIGQLQEEIHYTVQKGCEITSQQKGDFATLCKMLPSAWTCINWTSESAPKVAATTVIKNMLHGRFSLLLLLAFRIYSWQMTSKLCPRFLITLLNLGLLWEVEYSDWLANAVVIPKKGRKWRVYVNYTNLNDACPRDSFPLPE